MNIPGMVGHAIIGGAVEKGLTPLSHIASQAMWKAYPFVIPSPGEINDLRIRGFIDKNTWQVGMRSHGCAVPIDADPGDIDFSHGTAKFYSNLWAGAFNAQAEYPTSDQVLVLWNRGIVQDEATVDTLLQYNGMASETIRSYIKQLRFEIPGPSELVHFVLRHGFEPSVIEANRLNEEFPTSARAWLGKQGLDYPIQVTDPFTNQTSTTSWAEMYWATHWVPIAPTQAYVMLQRLRPSRIQQLTTEGVHPSVFTTQDLNRWLRINDYPPGIRDNLAAISYVPINSSDARSLYRMGLADGPELSELLQDNGYSVTSANTITGMEELIKARQRATMSHGWTPAALGNAYVSKQMTAEQVGEQMQKMGFSEKETEEMLQASAARFNYEFYHRARRKAQVDTETAVIDAYKSGLMPIDVASQELVNVGVDADFAEQILRAAEAKATAALTNKALTRVRGAFLRGEITIEQVGTLLTQFGVVPGRSAQLLALWQLELTPRRRQLARVDILRMVADGSLDVANARARLVNLGWIEPDRELLLVEASHKLEARQAAIRKAADKTIAGQLRQLDRQRRDALNQAKQALNQYRRLAPVSSLKKWAKLGIITPQQFITRMKVYGYDGPTITLHWQEACDAKGSVCDPQEPAIVNLSQGGQGTNGAPPAAQGGG